MGPTAPDESGDLYSRRFSSAETEAKERIWPEIVRYLGRYFDPSLPVLDLACDEGFFIRNVKASDRWASDIRDMSDSLPPEIRFLQADGLKLQAHVPHAYFGTVFMSNYLEHLPDRPSVVRQLHIVRELLRLGGRIVILQPNIRYVGAAYWDYIDHNVALTDKSVIEAAESVGFHTVHVIGRFLPYTTKSRLPVHPLAVRAYLAIPISWRLLGAQTLYVGERLV